MITKVSKVAVINGMFDGEVDRSNNGNFSDYLLNKSEVVIEYSKFDNLEFDLSDLESVTLFEDDVDGMGGGGGIDFTGWVSNTFNNVYITAPLIFAVNWLSTRVLDRVLGPKVDVITDSFEKQFLEFRKKRFNRVSNHDEIYFVYFVARIDNISHTFIFHTGMTDRTLEMARRALKPKLENIASEHWEGGIWTYIFDAQLNQWLRLGVS